MKGILLLEDDKSLNRGISFKLKKEGYNLFSASSIKEARNIFLENEISLIISDIGLPDGSGLDFCEEIRKQSDVYIIMLTALNQEIDIVTGYELGADDYITKPFSLMVLMSKINAVMKRCEKTNTNSLITCDDFTFDLNDNKLKKQGENILLSNTETKLLKYLMENSKQIISKEQLLEAIWDIDGNFIDENTLAVNIRRIRQKIEDNSSSPIYIKNVRGVGYIWDKRCIKR